MKKFRGWVLAAPVAAVLLIGLPMSAAHANPVNSVNNDQPGAAEVHPHDAAGHSWGRHKGMPMHGFHSIHRQEYMLLLAEKYTPSQVGAWRTIFAERKTLMKQLKPLWQEKKKQNKAEMQKKMNDLRAKVKSGKVTREQAMKQINQWRTERRIKRQQMQKKYSSHFKTIKDRQRQFTAAVQKLVDSGDEAGVKKMLPIMLDSAKQENEWLSDKLKEMKQSSGSSAAAK